MGHTQHAHYKYTTHARTIYTHSHAYIHTYMHTYTDRYVLYLVSVWSWEVLLWVDLFPCWCCLAAVVASPATVLFSTILHPHYPCTCNNYQCLIPACAPELIITVTYTSILIPTHSTLLQLIHLSRNIVATHTTSDTTLLQLIPVSSSLLMQHCCIPIPTFWTL